MFIKNNAILYEKSLFNVMLLLMYYSNLNVENKLMHRGF